MPAHVLPIPGKKHAATRCDEGQLRSYKSDIRIPHPSAVGNVYYWAKHNRGSLVDETLRPVVRRARTPGDDTEVMRFMQMNPMFQK
jgi:hypothetical protein